MTREDVLALCEAAERDHALPGADDWWAEDCAVFGYDGDHAVLLLTPEQDETDVADVLMQAEGEGRDR